MKYLPWNLCVSVRLWLGETEFFLFVSCSTSQSFWMSFPRTSWVSSWTILSSQRRACRWRWSHPQRPQRPSSRPSTATPCVRSLGPSHHSPTLPPATASMTVNSEEGKHLGPLSLWLGAPGGCGVCVLLLSAPPLATYLHRGRPCAWSVGKCHEAQETFLHLGLCLLEGHYH